MATLLDKATEIVDKIITQSNEDTSRTIFAVGSKSAGKSTLISNFLEKNEAPRETLVLEYSFGRKSGQKQGLEKIICHVWEYGGKLELLKNVLTSVPLHSKSYFIVMIDLSKIKTIWNTIETCVNCLKPYVEKSSSKDLLLIGGKYDLFNNYDSEIKKIICSTLRCVALINDAHLIFYSSKEPQLMRRVKEMLHNAAFGNGVVIKEKNVNLNKPLIIPKGFDSWESIGIPKSTMDQVKMRHVARIPLEVEAKEITNFELQRSHPEPILDSLAALKYEDIRNMELFDPSINDYLMCL
ncbi:PREDICTED: cytoplasmic dynein 2 light intermediate chain 1 [Papilio polytes]|uniref:cytoplasmic dynein 2 light intermediate chain 1 n=1 Tax=Papilio polytes TaxID=76194 RepID=UPI0006765BD1|nr:PREDICTED: cytoplasmic dynein 2 light intermediate chain 1 [Papilio polytes]